MFLSLFYLVVGFALLIKGADLFLTGAISFSKRLKIPSIVIGLTVVAFGTSAPELFISSMSALRGAADITLGNVVGSNISNILLVLGLSAAIYPLRASSKLISREIPFMFLTAIALWLVADDAFFAGDHVAVITRGDALLLLLFFIIFMYYLLSEAFKNNNEELLKKGYEEIEVSKNLSSRRLIFLALLGGLISLAVGGQLVITNAVSIALRLGITETLAGLTIVAIGGSLPELVTTLSAVKKREADMAIGNIVGSNIFNTVFVTGIAGAIMPLTLSPVIRFDIIFMIFVSFLMFLLTLTGKKVTRIEGLFLLVMFIGYLAYIVARG